ncbi:DUF397 domain-containing protein [Streptomyces sp. KLOTTS4A1]|uniref:DUF397 domain-containing protein n=1 Tax=Streptomyces sp. KLOTTS4A1 TaxID=3390996 RepID=UPI0039F5F0FF
MAEFKFPKSSCSSSDTHQECVEVASNIPSTVTVRGSKQTNGPTLHTSPAAWTAFTSRISTQSQPTQR